MCERVSTAVVPSIVASTVVCPILADAAPVHIPPSDPPSSFSFDLSTQPLSYSNHIKDFSRFHKQTHRRSQLSILSNTTRSPHLDRLEPTTMSSSTSSTPRVTLPRNDSFSAEELARAINASVNKPRGSSVDSTLSDCELSSGRKDSMAVPPPSPMPYSRPTSIYGGR